jgi:hypothetical protein
MNTTVIEINGVKMEVDLRHAKRVENIKIGTRVKVLRKEYQGYKVEHGIVIGFEPFESLPTIIIAVVALSFNDAKIDFVYYNSSVNDVEVVVAVDDDGAAIDREQVCGFIGREIVKHEQAIRELNARREYFLSKFASYWERAEKNQPAAES